MTDYKKCKILLGKFIREFNKKVIQENIFQINSPKNRNKYTMQCDSIIEGRQDVFVFELEDLLSTSHSELKDLAFFNTQRFLKLLKSTLFFLFTDFFFNLEEKKENDFLITSSKMPLSGDKFSEFINFNDFQIILQPPKMFPSEKLNLICASMIGKFILIEGICIGSITRITKLKFATYFCKFCGSKIYSTINDSTFKPVIYCFSKICEKKFNKKLFLDLTMSNFQTYQLVKISNIENPGSFTVSTREIDLYFNEKLYSNLTQGVKIRSAGILLPCGYESVVPVNFSMNFFFESMFFEKYPYNYFSEKPFLIKQHYIFELFRSPNLYDRISDSILPYFLGDLDLKKSITLAIVSSGSYLRGVISEIKQQVNILFIGNFNIGKSSVLQALLSISPNSIYLNSSTFSLKKQFSSTPGFRNSFFEIQKKNSQILNTGLILIENILFSKENEVFSLENFLDERVGLNEKSIANISIIASIAKIEDFDFQKDKKTNNSKNNFLKKFDLVFYQEHNSLNNFDEKISNYLLENYGKEKQLEKNERYIDIEILKVLFKESRHIYPKFTKLSIEMTVYNYVLLRATNVENFKKSINIKFLISLIRLSMALAKLNFNDLISIDDTKEASRLLTSSIKSLNHFKFSKTIIQKISIENKIYNLIRNTSVKIGKSILHLSHLAKLSSLMGYPQESFAKCLEIYENLNIWAISLKQMKLVFLL